MEGCKCSGQGAAEQPRKGAKGKLRGEKLQEGVSKMMGGGMVERMVKEVGGTGV